VPDKPQKTEASSTSKDQLISDFKVLIADIENLVTEITNDSIQNQAAESIQKIKSNITHIEESIVDKTVDAAVITNDYVHKNPWEAIGIAASLGLLIGLLSRKK
jgi:ElaB/YqjD/DUF883 family membrane-anchored ribosome-binding protein